MSKEALQNRLISKVTKDGRQDLFSAVSGKMRYKTSDSISYPIGDLTVNGEKNEAVTAAQGVLLKEAIRRVRNRLKKQEKEKQTFSGLVRQKLRDEGRIYSGKLSKSLFSTTDVSLLASEYNERKRNIPHADGIVQTEASYKAQVKNQVTNASRLNSKLKKEFGNNAASFALGVQVTLRALDYYDSIDKGFNAGDERFIPNTAKEFDRLRNWAKNKMVNTSTIQKQTAATINTISKWREEGREGDETSEYALERYRAFVTSEVRRELFQVMADEGLVNQFGKAEAQAMGQALMSTFSLQLAADYSRLQLAIGGARTTVARAKAVLESQATMDGGVATKKVKSQKKIAKKTISRTDQINALLKKGVSPEQEMELVEELVLIMMNLDGSI